ncbi:MAG: glycosyltransferase family 39 protein [Candidatus Moraniibacteriota bacterium]
MLARIVTTCKERKWELLLLLMIIAVGIFLRAYNFHDWLLFEIDQSYDTRIVSGAIEHGVGHLPLLGPTAGGGRALRLGPAFYYMEYASALIFGNTPAGHAALVLIFSILAIPLFYVFIRRYFTLALALALTTLFSTSVFLILYGRFSWSPNVLPFLTILSFYALLRSVSQAEPRRNTWFLTAAAAIAITSQIHFNAFFTIPTIAILFLLYKRPTFKLKIWIAALGIVAAVYTPVILSDISTQGANVNLFLKKISKTSAAPLGSFQDTLRKAMVDLNYNASGYFFINSGIDRINGKRIQGYGLQDDANLPWRAVALVLFCAELALLAYALRKEQDTRRTDFLVLLSLWIVVPFAYFYSLISSNFHFYPRFYLLIAPAAIILFGMLLEKIHPETSAARRLSLALIVLLFLIPNLTRIQSHFLQLATPARNKVNAETEDIFPNDKRLTLKEALAVTEYMLARQQENHYPIYLNTYHEYEPLFWYHLTKRGMSYSDKIDFDSLYAEGNYFLIQYPTDGTRGIEKAFDIIDEKRFGILTVYTLVPDDGKIRTLRQNPENRKQLEQTLQIQELKTWNDLF